MLIKKVEDNNVIWGIWKIEESLETLFSMLDSTDDLLHFSEKYKSGPRMLEKVAVRVLLKTLLGNELEIGYKESGRPYLKNSEFNITITHTKGYAAVAISNAEYLGIDIEYISDRVKKVKTKFISENEYIDPENETLHLLIHWSAKESLYKALDVEGVDFREHLIIERFVPQSEGIICAQTLYPEMVYSFNLQYFVSEDYVLTLLCK